MRLPFTQLGKREENPLHPSPFKITIVTLTTIPYHSDLTHHPLHEILNWAETCKLITLPTTLNSVQQLLHCMR